MTPNLTCISSISKLVNTQILTSSVQVVVQYLCTC